MKNVAIVLGAFLTLFLVACEGDPGFDGIDGPQGPQGPPGINGEQAQVFEVDGVNMDYDATQNLFKAPLSFQDFTTFEVLPNDAILVYRFDGVVGFEDGSESDSWGLLPQNFFVDQGTIQYVTSHTQKDVQILIDGNFDLSGISTDFTDNQLFRVVIVPGVSASTAKMDKSNISSVMSSLGISEKDVQKIRMN